MTRINVRGFHCQTIGRERLCVHEGRRICMFGLMSFVPLRYVQAVPVATGNLLSKSGLSEAARKLCSGATVFKMLP